MSYFNDICVICLEYSTNLTIISSQDINGTSFVDKLEYFVPELELKSNIPKYICTKCELNLNKSYEFKQKCLQNVTTYQKYAQQITTTDRCDYTKQIDVNKVEIEEFIIKEETLPGGIKEESIDIIEQNVQDLQQTIPEPHFKCSECPKKFSKPKDFKAHIRSHIKAFPCNICLKNFTSSSHVVIHKRTHTGAKPFQCDICKKTFSTSGYLQIHRRIHTGERPYPCDICQKSFRASTDLNSHKRIHNNDRRYQCTVCLRAFTQSGHLARHIMTHSGEKPYECEKCEYKCSDSSNLRKHISRTHTDN